MVHSLVIVHFCSEKLLQPESNSLSKYSARFDGLLSGTEYLLYISTELDGKTVVQTKRSFKTSVKPKDNIESDNDKDNVCPKD